MDSNVSFQYSSADLYLLTMYRTKQIDFSPINIEELISYKAGQFFNGDVIVTYRAILDKLEKSTELLCAYLTYAKGEMEVTLNFRTSFIEQHQAKLLPGKAICITNFKVTPKTNYDHGEAKFILPVEQESSIENIAIRRLLANTSIMKRNATSYQTHQLEYF